MSFEFDIQRHIDYKRDYAELNHHARRRISGNYGRVLINDMLVFELKSFSAKVIADREDVYIGHSLEGKITGLKGEGEMTIHHVITRNFDKILDSWKRGHDDEFVLIGEISDPDALNDGIERVKFGYCWWNELEILKFEKGSVVEKTLPFGFNPDDVTYESIIQETDAQVYEFLAATGAPTNSEV